MRKAPKEKKAAKKGPKGGRPMGGCAAEETG